MRRLLLLIAVVLATSLVTGACSSSTTVKHTAAPGSISIAAQGIRHYGAGTRVSGQDGSGVTGWYYETTNNRLIAVTIADMQAGCDHEHPGMTIVHPANPPPPWGNSQWHCIPEKGHLGNTYLENADGSVSTLWAPGAQDVSTMAAGKRFYAVPDFTYFQKCGPPCNFPMYRSATEKLPAVTHGWPCEYYYAASAIRGQYCLQPSAGRTASQMADSAIATSGDRVLVLCQVMGENIHDEQGHYSSIWDKVAVPIPYLLPGVLGRVPLTPVPNMPGYVEAFGSDVWFGDTGLHGISCN